MKILKILLSVWSFLMMAFRKTELKELVKGFIEPATDLVELFKKSVESDQVDFLVSLTKSDWDNEIQEKLISLFSGAILKLKDIREWSQGEPLSNEQLIQKFQEWLRTQTPTMQSAMYKQLASTMVFNAYKKDDKDTKEFAVDAFSSLTYAVNKVQREKLLS
jgi:hypothetical protein